MTSCAVADSKAGPTPFNIPDAVMERVNAGPSAAPNPFPAMTFAEVKLAFPLNFSIPCRIVSPATTVPVVDKKPVNSLEVTSVLEACISTPFAFLSTPFGVAVATRSVIRGPAVASNPFALFIPKTTPEISLPESVNVFGVEPNTAIFPDPTANGKFMIYVGGGYTSWKKSNVSAKVKVNNCEIVGKEGELSFHLLRVILLELS